MIKKRTQNDMLCLLEKYEKDFQFLSDISILMNFNSEFVFFTHEDESGLNGILKMKINGNGSYHFPDFFNWLSFVEVKPEKQNCGIARKLVESAYEFLSKTDQDHILISEFTKEGKKKLKPLIQEISQKYPGIRTKFKT